MYVRTLPIIIVLSTVFLQSQGQNTFPSTGNVGIGTTTPLKLLHVNGIGAFGNQVTTGNSIRALNLADANAVMRILRVHATSAPAVELISRTTADGPNVAYWDFYAEPSDKSFRIRDRVGGGSGLDRITVSSTGNVGVGTTTPLAKLHVNDQTAVSSFTGANRAGLRIQGLGTPNNYALLGFTGYSNSYTNNLAQIGATFTSSGSSLSFGTSNNYLSGITNTAMTIDYNGNVGLGTTNIDHKLVVQSAKIEGNNNTNLLKLTGRNPVLSFTDENNVAFGYLKTWTNAPYAPFTNGMIVGSTPGNPIFLSTNYGATMTIANNNNVGIGTTTPGYKLEIKSTTVQSNNNTAILKVSGRNPLMGFYDENDNAFGYIKCWTNAPYAPFTNGMLIGSNPGYPIFLSTNYGVTMTIADNNNVGIGTTNPAYKLSVNGTIQAKEVRVETGWADYVFDASYKLRSLREVEDFIQRYRHLPDVPSAKEIQDKGLQLGDMQTKMMSKIEELTLYIIDLQKQIEELKKRK